MSGAVNTVKDVATVVSSPMWMPVKAGVNLVAHGTNPIRDLGDSAKIVMGGTKRSVVDPFMQGAGLASEPPPNIAAEDPAAVAERDRKDRARVKRQTEVDLLTGQPGRGGTILTDQYQYNV
jgi:hypothetical protein